MDSVNVFEGRYEFDPEDPPGYRAGAIHLTRALGAAGLAVKSFVLAPGETVCPYHYEYEEEWLLVLDGEVSVRTPAGEQSLVRGDIVRFAKGPEGAHKVANHRDLDARILMFSSEIGRAHV